MVTIVAIEAGVCPECGAPLVRSNFTEYPLLRGGGYGAARQTVASACVICGWGHTHAVGEVRP